MTPLIRNIETNCDFYDKEEILKTVIKTMQKDGVAKEYFDSIPAREAMASFNIGSQIAIPHGTYEGSQYIDQSKIYIWHCKNPVLWDDSDVRIIIALALKGSEQPEALQNIAINVTNESFLKSLLHNPSQEIFMKLLEDND